MGGCHRKAHGARDDAVEKRQRFSVLYLDKTFTQKERGTEEQTDRQGVETERQTDGQRGRKRERQGGEQGLITQNNSSQGKD